MVFLAFLTLMNAIYYSLLDIETVTEIVSILKVSLTFVNNVSYRI